MKHHILLLLFIFSFCLLPVAGCFPAVAEEGSPLQIAVLPLNMVQYEADGLGSAELEAALEKGLESAGCEPLPDSWVTSVMRSDAGREINFNPSCEEAHALGAALGCDFYVIGQVVVAARSASDRTMFHELAVNLLYVDTRTGSLVKWENIAAKGATLEQAKAEALRLVREAGETVAVTLTTFRKKQQSPPENPLAVESEILDLRNETTPENVTLPAFLKQLHPTPTEAAKDAHVEAHVAAEILLDSNGHVADVRIVRWAGYGLDEAVQQAIRGSTFKPATRRGIRAAARFLAVYNFRHVRE